MNQMHKEAETEVGAKTKFIEQNVEKIEIELCRGLMLGTQG